MRQIPFRIVALKVESFVLTTNKPQVGRPVEVSTSYEFGVSVVDHLVMARLTYKYLQDKVELLQMPLISTFDVKSEAFSTMIDGNKFTLEPFFSQYISSINVGAARGEIHARCEQANSELANIILPPINLVEALPEPIEIELKSKTEPCRRKS